MVRKNVDGSRTKTLTLFTFFVAVLLLLLAGFFMYKYFIVTNTHHYAIGDAYYGFEIQTPTTWIAEKNMAFSDVAIAQTVADCKANNFQAPADMGMFRFQDKKYPENFGQTTQLQSGFPSGAILQITVACIPAGTTSQVANNEFNATIAGNKANEVFLNSVFGKTKTIFIYHNTLQYKIEEYVYVAPADQSNESAIQNKYQAIFNTIISSIKIND